MTNPCLKMDLSLNKRGLGLEHMGYIYKIVNNVNDKVYVGKTCRTLTIRWKEHCKHCNEGVDYPIYRAMKKYGIDAFHMELIEECNNADICNKEKYWIKYYNSYENGYNATRGGDGNYIVDVDYILSLWEQGYNMTEIENITHHTRKTISNHLKGCLGNFDGRKNRKIAKSDYPKSRPKNVCGKQVAQIDKQNGQIIQIFPSARQAERDTGINHGHISEVCNKTSKRKTAGGFKWKYIE